MAESGTRHPDGNDTSTGSERHLTQDKQPIRVGVTGHRDLGEDPAVGRYVHAECVRILTTLDALARDQQTTLEAYSALAIGADQIFARAAIGLGVPLVGVIPFEDYPDDFLGAERDDFETLLAHCYRVHRMLAKGRTSAAYLKAGQWIVDHVDHLVAVWDGEPAEGIGGTGDIVAYARAKGRPVIVIGLEG